MSDAPPAAARRAALRADLGLVGVALIWGVNFSVMKAALGDVSPFAYNAVRLVMTAVFLALWQRREPPTPASEGGRLLPRVVVLSLLGSVSYQVLFLVGLDLTTAMSSSLLIATSPLWTPLLATLLGRERLRGLAWAGLVVGVAGSLLVLAARDHGAGGAGSLLGNGLTVLAALSWSLFAVLNQNVSKAVPPARLALWFTLIALPVHLVLAIPHYGDLFAPDLSPWIWAALLYSGVFSTGVAYALWNTATRALGPSHTAAAGTLVPVFAVVVAWLTLGERLAPGQLGVGLLVLTGLALVRRGRRE